MKRLMIFGSLCLTLLLTPSCDTLQQIAGDVVKTGTSGQSGLTNGEVISGLKEALNIGIGNSVNVASLVGGFLNNSQIRLPFPKDAEAVKDYALKIGLQGQVTKFEETLNHAAEEAAKSALPIFKNAITGMTIQDGFQILNGGNGAATNYLKNATRSQLVSAFSPIVEKAIDKVQLTKLWEPIVSKYNLAAPILGKPKVNEDLNAYVTGKAIDGLFVLVAQEENKIRTNVNARVTDLLKKVFGSIGKN